MANKNHLRALEILLDSAEGTATVDAILAERAPGWVLDHCPSGSIFACKRGEPYSVWMTPGWNLCNEEREALDGPVPTPVQVMRDEDAEPHPAFDNEPDHMLDLCGHAQEDIRTYAVALAAMCLRVEAASGQRVPHRTPECMQEDHLNTRDDEEN